MGHTQDFFSFFPVFEEGREKEKERGGEWRGRENSGEERRIDKNTAEMRRGCFGA